LKAVIGFVVLAGVPACGNGGGSPGAGGADPAHLDPPPMGQGFQFGTPEFTVPPGIEEQDCYFFKVSDLAMAGGLAPTLPVNLHHVQVAQRAGSHHMNIFRVKTVVNLGPANGPVVKGQNGMGECFKSSNWADWPLVANSQQEGDIDWTYPDGVANVFQPDEYLMLQTHFVNATTQQTPAPAKVTVDFWTLPASAVTAELGTIFATKQSIRICQSNPTPSFSGSCQINSPNPVQIIGANGHFHSRGKEFDMYLWDGLSTTTPPAAQRFYQSLAWNEPPMIHSPELNVTAPAQGGVFYTCSYQWMEPPPAIGCTGLNAFDEMKYMTPANKVDCCYTFGPQVDLNEHCNAFVYYYPKQDNVNCF
jgi:hypothetical protein